MIEDELDFTNCKKLVKGYGGGNGNKISILYNDEIYMLKFPPIAKFNKEISYTNGCITEDLGCRIFTYFEIPTQETLLGKYRVSNGKEKTVVACKDFTTKDWIFQDFASVKNTIVEDEKNGYDTELTDVLMALDKQKIMPSILVKERFWDMFIVDCFIANPDRHNGNWGVLVNTERNVATLAPVFDCGSSLYPQVDDKVIDLVLSDESELLERVYRRPPTAFKCNNQKFKYYDFFSTTDNKDFKNALKRFYSKIDMDDIYDIVGETKYLSDRHKNYLAILLSLRKTHILDIAYKRLLSNNIHFTI